MEDFFEKRIRELSAKSFNGYTFTHFLDMEEQSKLHSIKNEIAQFELFGGCDGTERVVAKFGNLENLGYEEDFPITIIKCEVQNIKFAENLTHRDFLGALMNLGIERKYIGDIAAIEGGAYIFAMEKIADYICENLVKVKHTAVKCEKTAELPKALYKIKGEKITVPSLRCDCAVAEAFRFSRSESTKMFDGQKVFVNGKCTVSPGTQIKENDIISLRGSGRFKILEIGGKTRKGNIYLTVGRYM